MVQSQQTSCTYMQLQDQCHLNLYSLLQFIVVTTTAFRNRQAWQGVSRPLPSKGFSVVFLVHHMCSLLVYPQAHCWYMCSQTCSGITTNRRSTRAMHAGNGSVSRLQGWTRCALPILLMHSLLVSPSRILD